MLAAGGWGWILGDEGSAPALVRDAAKAIRGAIDAGDGADPLTDALMAELGTDDPTMLGRLLNDTRSAVIWGRYANAVFAAADAGSRLAQGVIIEGGAALAALVGVIVKRGADAASVVAGGGVIVEQPRLMAAFAAAMKKVSPNSAVVLLREPPVMGALALAERAMPAGATLKAGDGR
jgi:N-acetylglucosamine kinase-like BadF-type ATPase